MSEKEMLALVKGDYVMYFGPVENEEGLEIGEMFEVVDTFEIGFQIKVDETYCPLSVYLNARWAERSVSSYKVFPKSGDETELQPEDYEFLTDYALDLKDFDWAREIHEMSSMNSAF